MVNINLTELDKKIEVVIVGYNIKGKKNPQKVYHFTSRVQVFYKPSEASKFVVEALNELRSLDPTLIYEAYYVSPKAVKPQEGSQLGGKYYCPYCSQINYLVINNNTGYQVCPICGYSMSDFYFKKYNNLWNKENGEGNNGKKVRKRRQKKDDSTKG